ncbi:MAG: hypothetical protein IPH85_14300 [Ignavibacteria bacterium]|nr:hypothetical protein [Ignavibacteria bacterium]
MQLHSRTQLSFTKERSSAMVEWNTWYLPTDAPGALVSNRTLSMLQMRASHVSLRSQQRARSFPPGSQTEFATIAQWRNWTGQDINSVVGNFTTDFVYNGVAPNQQLRVKVTPQPPVGSILNNRGGASARYNTGHR